MSYLIGENMVVGYGGADILNNCSINVDKGEIASILANGFVEAGTYSSVWNGQDALGREASSGVYILQLTTENKVLSNKITLLR